ncbi:MAG: hypothetical protein H0V37_14165 [Chloroflexia bacterium]|nr:hypothetical protein [Chloroflexia bacterium]
MRRLVSMFTPGKSWIVLSILFVATAGWFGVSSSITAQTTPASPEALAAGPEIIPIDVVEYPAADASSEPHILYLMRVEFGPNVPAPPAHIHAGEFVLTVASGAVCYELVNVDATTTVTADLLPGAATNDACNANQDFSCVEDAATGIRTCTLESGESVYVPEGSSITQQGASAGTANVGANHTYGNVDDVPAVVFLAGYQVDIDGAGCGGHCW